MTAFPVALRLAGRTCLVVGSGAQAARRTRELLEAGAHVRLVAPHPIAPVRALSNEAAVTLEERQFEKRDLDGVWLAVLAERQPELAARIESATLPRQIFFCAVDQPEHNTFFHMARARAGKVQAAITTSGTAPSLARRLAEELQRLFDEAGLAAFAEKLAELRRATPSGERAEVLGRAVVGLRLEGKLELD